MKIYPSAILSLITGPIRTEISEGRVILTHLQKFSHFGFMLTYPLCFHFWLMFILQKNHSYDNYGTPTLVWEAGTERGIYFRTPGYRWDADLGMKWTWGYFGFHLD